MHTIDRARLLLVSSSFFHSVYASMTFTFWTRASNNPSMIVDVHDDDGFYTYISS